MLRVFFGALQAVSQSRESHADDYGVLALGEDGAVVDLDVLYIVIGEDDAGHGRKRHEDLVILFAVEIVDVDPDLTGFAGQVCGCDLLLVQVISDLLGDGRRLFGRSLIIDVISARVPCQNIAALRKGLITLDVLYILKDRIVVELVRPFVILEPAGHCHALLIAVCIGKNIDRLFFFGPLGLLTFADCCRECLRQIFLRDRIRLLRAPENAPVHGRRSCRKRVHRHICCHRHCKEQGQNLFSSHDFQLLYPDSFSSHYIICLILNGTAQFPDFPFCCLYL